MYRTTREFLEELLCRNTDLVQVAAVAELYAHGHHVNIESLHVIVGNIGSRVGDNGELIPDSMYAVLLPVHIVGFFAADTAVLSCQVEHVLWRIDVNVYLGLSFGTGKHEGAP